MKKEPDGICRLQIQFFERTSELEKDEAIIFGSSHRGRIDILGFLRDLKILI